MAVSAFDRAREAYRAVVHGIDEKVLLFFIQFLALYVSPRPMDSLTSQAGGVADLVDGDFFGEVSVPHQVAGSIGRASCRSRVRQPSPQSWARNPCQNRLRRCDTRTPAKPAPAEAIALA
jgi:hypothetical protein